MEDSGAQAQVPNPYTWQLGSSSLKNALLDMDTATHDESEDALNTHETFTAHDMLQLQCELPSLTQDVPPPVPPSFSSTPYLITGPDRFFIPMAPGGRPRQNYQEFTPAPGVSARQEGDGTLTQWKQIFAESLVVLGDLPPDTVQRQARKDKEVTFFYYSILNN